MGYNRLASKSLIIIAQYTRIIFYIKIDKALIHKDFDINNTHGHRTWYTKSQKKLFLTK